MYNNCPRWMSAILMEVAPMSSVLFASICFLLAAPAIPATIYVPDDHSTIQAAVDASVAGDTIIV